MQLRYDLIEFIGGAVHNLIVMSILFPLMCCWFLAESALSSGNIKIVYTDQTSNDGADDRNTLIAGNNALLRWLTQAETDIRKRDELIDRKDAEIEALESKIKSLSDDQTQVEIRSMVIDAKPRYEPITIILNGRKISADAYIDGLKTAQTTWIVIQRRFDGSENFHRNWNEYKNGFGNVRSEYFIGLENLHVITHSQPHVIYIEFEDFNGNVYHAQYDNFRVGGEDQLYKLETLGKYRGDSGDYLSSNINNNFSTFDEDNDNSPENCAAIHFGGWWYDHCSESSLNGKYKSKEEAPYLKPYGVYWGSLTKIKRTIIMIKPKSV